MCLTERRAGECSSWRGRNSEQYAHICKNGHTEGQNLTFERTPIRTIFLNWER